MPRSVRPQQSGLERDPGRPQTRWLATYHVLLEGLRTGIRNSTFDGRASFISRSAQWASQACSPSSDLDRPPAGESGGGSSRGALHTPTAKGSLPGGKAGALRSFTRAGCKPLIARSPVPGCISPRRGFAANAALGRGERRVAGRRRDPLRPALAQLMLVTLGNARTTIGDASVLETERTSEVSERSDRSRCSVAL